ncbi:phosphatase PAP2 family protein [Fructilactobacillus hinvesii]|uniref:Phosphatase PAP2 family protein n=1 Tax=Fructilactobacillus hinvesii TaxID=2940300 RepID=A0ABY5BUX0_9LACO|nr:phosphatase PAP2 family protein [Fructilactobacillus hinvesii]USS88066.1 phosphatase PAP2 family protein [Fructilactobacillus hinvesii]
MNQQRKWLLGSLVLFVVLMGIATKLDLTLSQRVLNYHSNWATIGQTVGSFPLYLVFILSGEIMIASAFRQSNAWLAGLGLVVGVTLSSLQLLHFLRESSNYFGKAMANLQHGLPVGSPNPVPEQRGSAWGWLLLILWLFLYLVITLLSQWWLKQQSPQRLQQLLIIAIFASLTALLALGANGFLKTIWGRYRPYQVQGQLSHFTNWYQINGINGHYSFPSGHTMASTLALVLGWFVTAKWQRTAWWLGLGYSILIAVSRLVIGAHFLSDVTFSFFLTATIIYVMKRCLINCLRSNGAFG